MTRFILSAMALGLTVLAGCASERDIETWNDESYRQYPEDATQLGDFWVVGASLNGTLGSDTFDGEAETFGYHDPYGNRAVEVAMATDRGAVMHLIEFENGTLDTMQPGETFSVVGRESGGVTPRACTGQTVGSWDVDMPIESVDFTMTDNDDGTRNLDWTLVNLVGENREQTEASSGRLLLSDTPFDN